MTTVELKQQLVQQYNEMAVNLQRLEGAIAACDKLLEPESTDEDEATDD